MQEALQQRAITRMRHFAGACGIGCAIFELNRREFLLDCQPDFCNRCAFRGRDRCVPQSTHLYGCFEAERWNGLYIYYCPMSLVFIATTLWENSQPELTAIAGPLVMGVAADVLSDNGGIMVEEILALPCADPARVTCIAQTQWSVSMFLSGRDCQRMEYSDEMKFRMLNTLYDVTAQIQQTQDYSYPMEIERQLQQMIIRGDKQGSQELINQLLGHLYFHSNGNFETIKERAAELVVLFSRASIDGGADVSQIFGVNRDMLAEINSFKDLDALSVFLTSIFHRFVGYVFDFDQIKHVDVIHKVVDYIRQNYTRHISMDDVAAHVYLSKSYLSKIFKDEVNCSFTGYVNKIRVEKSRELLADPKISLAEIATLVGFDDQSYFTKVFRRIAGVSPGQFRKSGGARSAHSTEKRD